MTWERTTIHAQLPCRMSSDSTAGIHPNKPVGMIRHASMTFDNHRAPRLQESERCTTWDGTRRMTRLGALGGIAARRASHSPLDKTVDTTSRVRVGSGSCLVARGLFA